MRQRALRLPVLLGLIFGLAGADCGTEMKVAGYEGDDRESWQQIDRVIETLGLSAGQQVADIGSGSGYFTRHLAPAVAPGGRVFAVDVDPEMNAYLEARLAEEGIENVTVVLAEPGDPGLVEGSIDLVFTSNTYHHLPNQRAYFAGLRPYLAPGARLAVVEYEPSKAGWFARTFGHATPKAQIVAAIVAAGYRLEADHDFLERQSFLIFEPSTP
ncbi:MAG: class I SAM-dependent methyltransferase [Deltaproteobacteria bacterium]|nr:class I SAM-dependent methyltransferase [Deltaproteobacteria bacterium]MBW2445633.1 class I SAM-dependent methyltransferase [Deltaproteobacteria bacterium]